MPTKDESDPITDDEWLYRRVHVERFRTGREPFVSPSAFEPRGTNSNDPDVDGISLFRADCLENPADVLAMIADLQKRSANGIVKILVKEIRQLGLTVVPTPRKEIPGHVSIPELSTKTHEEKREEIKRLMTAMAVLSSPEDRIVLPPKRAKHGD